MNSLQRESPCHWGLRSHAWHANWHKSAGAQSDKHIPFVDLGRAIQVEQLGFQPLFLSPGWLAGGVKSASEQTRHQFLAQQGGLREGQAVSRRVGNVAFTTTSEPRQENNSEDPDAKFESYNSEKLPTLTKFLKEGAGNISWNLFVC